MTYNLEQFTGRNTYQPLINDSRFFDNFDDYYLVGGTRSGCGQRLRAIYKHMGVKNGVYTTVLDIGCNIGFFCHALQSKGSIDCTGVDNNDHGETHGQVDVLKTARELSIAYGKHPLFVKKEFAELTTEKPYDYVLCLSVFHHLLTQADTMGKDVKAYAAGALSMLYELTKKTLYIEVDMTIPAAKKAGFSTDEILDTIHATLGVYPDLVLNQKAFGYYRMLLAITRT